MIDTSDLEIIYSGEAGQEEFSITFPYASPDDIKVYIADSDVPLAASEYSITSNKVVLSTPLEEAATVRITRNTPLTQETQYINQGTTDLTRIEHSFDKLTMIAQENHNSMATVDSRVNSNMSSIAASTAAVVESATAVYRNEASGYAASAASAETNASAWANSASAAASVYGNAYVAGSGITITEIISGGSNYKQIRTLVDGSTINYTGNGYLSAIPPERIVSASAANPLSASVSNKTLNLNFKYDSHFGIDSNGNLTLLSGGGQTYSAGSGIAISDGGISVKADGSTVGFDSNGNLSCSVSGSAIPYVGSNGIDVNGTVISAKLDGSTISTNASGELQCLVSGGQTYSAGDGVVISDGVVTAKVDNSTMGFDNNGALSCMISGGETYSAGSGIGISGGVISTKVDSSTIAFDTSGRLSCLVSGGSGGSITGSNGLVVSGGVVAPTSTLIFEMPIQSYVYSSGNYTMRNHLSSPGNEFKLETWLNSANNTSVYTLIHLNNYNHFQIRCVSNGSYDVPSYGSNFSKGMAKLEYEENLYYRLVGSGDYDRESHTRTGIMQTSQIFGISAVSGSSRTGLTQTKCEILAGGMTISAGDYALRITHSGIFAVSGDVSSSIFQ